MIMPDKIGGFYIATLVNKPGAVEFFSFLSHEYESDIYFEEIRFEDAVIAEVERLTRDAELFQERDFSVPRQQPQLHQH